MAEGLSILEQVSKSHAAIPQAEEALKAARNYIVLNAPDLSSPICRRVLDQIDAATAALK